MEKESIHIVFILIGLIAFMFAVALLGKHALDKAMSEKKNQRNYSRNGN